MPQSELVHGLFTPVEAQIDYWRHKMPRLVDADLEVFLTQNPAPEWPEERLMTVVLSLHTPLATQDFHLYWTLIAERQARSWKWDQFIFNDEHVRHFRREEKAWRWSWGVVDLGANRNTSPDAVREQASGVLPGAEILAAGVLHPGWVRAMNGKDVPFVFMPGYEISVLNLPVWQYVPNMSFDCDTLEVELTVSWCVGVGAEWGVPEFVRGK